MIDAGHVALIVNARARRGAESYDAARRALLALGYGVDGHAVADPARIGDVTAAALRRQPDILVLGGGDGTLSGVVDLLAGGSVPLALLPLGTANSFARGMGIPLDLDEALNLLGAGFRRRIDLGRIDADCFANQAAMGLAPCIARTIPPTLKRWGGRAGYALWALVQLSRFHPFEVRIAGRIFRAVEVRIANGSHQGGAPVARAAGVESGDLLVQVIEGRGRWRLLRNWLGALLGGRQHDLIEFRTRQCAISAAPPQSISVDGEVGATTPVTVSVLPGALEIFAPPPWSGAPVRDLSRGG